LNNIIAKLVQSERKSKNFGNFHTKHTKILLCFAPIFSYTQATHTSAEHIFEQFIHLLEDPHRPLSNVIGYAELLHITPKYFSSICKKMSGKTANEIIKEETIKKAKILLHDNSLSIKQVADMLDFSNQSHFGTYFHRYTGMSPLKFRQDRVTQNPGGYIG